MQQQQRRIRTIARLGIEHLDRVDLDSSVVRHFFLWAVEQGEVRFWRIDRRS
ncbi:hypothetical protein [Variovorax saccharolyticus]|uniref:hypothetical protein n=1 Tax=Variovorax saccharolyticus TaxID=3053516 RepID=UPI002578281C|nr:hypothetical protein [Variovorax sp. J31P216]MDM0028811.1 hypothetical protein [Variovorax sp. J31P216]